MTFIPEAGACAWPSGGRAAGGPQAHVFSSTSRPAPVLSRLCQLQQEVPLVPPEVPATHTLGVMVRHPPRVFLSPPPSWALPLGQDFARAQKQEEASCTTNSP